MRRGKRMMHRVPTFGFGIPIKGWKMFHPEKIPFPCGYQFLLFGHAFAQKAQHFERHRLVIRDEEGDIAFFGFSGSREIAFEFSSGLKNLAIGRSRCGWLEARRSISSRPAPWRPACWPIASDHRSLCARKSLRPGRLCPRTVPPVGDCLGKHFKSAGLGDLRKIRQLHAVTGVGSV